MGAVIRPKAFVRAEATPPRHVKRRTQRIDGRVLSIFVALVALAWIIALAGAAFTIRALLLLCFATLAGRVRRVGLQAPRL
jgi:hypothetical protein